MTDSVVSRETTIATGDVSLCPYVISSSGNNIWILGLFRALTGRHAQRAWGLSEAALYPRDPRTHTHFFFCNPLLREPNASRKAILYQYISRCGPVYAPHNSQPLIIREKIHFVYAFGVFLLLFLLLIFRTVSHSNYCSPTVVRVVNFFFYHSVGSFLFHFDNYLFFFFFCIEGKDFVFTRITPFVRIINLCVYASHLS